MTQGWLRRAFLIGACSLSLLPGSYAADIQYARAIGEPYEYRPSAGATGSSGSTSADSSLPGLGTDTPPRPAATSSSTWTRVLVGALVVGALAAIANKGGGGEGEVQLNASGDSGSTTASPPLPSSSEPPPSGSTGKNEGKDNGKGRR